MSGPWTGYVQPCSDMSGHRPDMSGQDRSTRKMSINHVLLVETLSNLTQGYSNTLGTTYSRIMTCIVGYDSRSQKLEYDSRLDLMQDNDILVVLPSKEI
jgi:hypothetical protein